MNIFSFFKFYYYVIRKSPKKYDIAMNSASFVTVLVTPMILMLLYFFSAGLFLSTIYTLFGFLWIPIFLGNFIFANKVNDEAFRIKLAENEKRRQMERMLWEQEMERSRQERARAYEQERKAREKMWQELNDHIHHQSQQPDRNMRNAMHLLGLSDGFTKKDVKAAYRKMSKTHHPDVGGLEVNFKKLNTAYKYVMDRI